jgi:hypothetical protein
MKIRSVTQWKKWYQHLRRVQGEKILKCPTVMLYMHYFLSFFQWRIHTMKSWYVNFSSPYVDSSISANYMVGVDIYLHASALWSGGSIVDIKTRLWTGRGGVWILVGARDISLFQNVQTGSLEPTQLPVQWVQGVLSQGKGAGAWS